MKKHNRIIYLAALITLGFIIYGCNQESAPSLYQEKPEGATPVVSSVLPANEALAGVADITINGSNFSPVKEDNLVYFGTAQANVLEASATRLLVKAPNLIKNNLDLKIAVKGVEKFSTVVKYNLLEAVGVFYAFTKGIDDPMTVTVDKNENVLVYIKDQGIRKIDASGKLTVWAPRGAESFFFDMKIGPNNILYGTRNLRAIFKVEEGKPTATYSVIPRTTVALIALDFDENKNLWTGGSGGYFYSITPALVIKEFPIDYTISAMRVYNGYLYVAGKNSTEEAIYRYKINSNESLGDKEKYFDIGAAYGLQKVRVGSMTFSSDGDLIIGTDLANAFILFRNGSASSLYPGLIGPYARSIGWGINKNLYYVRESPEAFSLVRVDMQKLSAPYYGR
ncbi:MAG: IPT/TIG domain-containing protein [Melioribacteraceae bacterium]|nr:IPT/TIG domain-containing protein [Melioribacteraceae bacterium]